MSIAASQPGQFFGTNRRCRALWVFFALILAVLLAGSAYSADVTLEWDPNTEADLAGYKIHYGTTSGQYVQHVDVGNVTHYTITGLSDGVYYFAATAYNTSGIESAYSNEISTEIVTNPCTYTISPQSAQFGPSGGTGSVEVTAPSGCAWTAADAPPLTVSSGRSGSGSGTVTYVLPANTSANAITVTSLVAGQIFTVQQSASAFTVIAAAGEGGSISPAGTVTVSKGASERFLITANTGYRVADVLVDGVSMGAVSSYTFSNVAASHMISATFTTEIVTNPCTYTISPQSAQFGPSGGTGSVAVTAPPGCAWTAADASPLTITSGGSGSGNGIVTYTLPANMSTNTVTVSSGIAGYIFTVKQSASALTIIAAAGSGGSISPAGTVTVRKGESKRFLITANTGYRVADVLVDGVSIGAVRSYTFSNVTASHMISATFRRAASSWWLTSASSSY